tara:strand:- start:475 stop:828 length:354 start_codon:yes stop_codon:yes gene_type:complete
MTTTVDWKTTTDKDVKEYCGVADAHGIESFSEYPTKKAWIMAIRATSNRQRHAVFYIARLEEVDAERISGFIEDGKGEQALRHLQRNLVNQEVMLAGGGDVSGSWDLIPNPKLDPWA